MVELKFAVFSAVQWLFIVFLSHWICLPHVIMHLS